MELPENYILERKTVKRWRISISGDGITSVVVPERFSNTDVKKLLHEKKDWIERKLREFRARTKKIELKSGQILFLGEPYEYLYDERHKKKVAVDHELKIIRSEANLLDIDIQEKWQRAEAKKKFVERTEEFARLHGFSYNRIYIRDQRSRWGSCSSKKNLSFNWRLIKAPEFALDYLVLHELLHTVIMSHCKRFYSRLDSICPDNRRAAEWLDAHGHNL